MSILYTKNLPRFTKKIIPDYILMIVRAIFFPNRLIVMKNPTFNFDGLASVHEVAFMNDERFLNALQFGKMYTPNRDDYFRLYIGCALAEHALKLDGDFVECGVWLGAMSKTIISYIEFNASQKKFYLIDTFEGIPTGNLIEKDGRQFFVYTDTGERKDDQSIPGDPKIIDLVRVKFENDRAEIIQGLVPDILKTIPADKVAFLHVDMNNAYPEVESIRFFWNKLVIGGIILLDDYAYSKQYEIQKQSTDKLGKELKFSVITLPTGQGLIIKY